VNFDFTDDQREIKRTARDLLTARSSLEAVRAVAEGGGAACDGAQGGRAVGGGAYDDALWDELVALGWPGIAIAERFGGQGLGVLELTILLEELGFALTPSRMLSNAAAGLFVDAAGSDAQREELLPGIAAGTATATVALARDRVAELVPDADSAAWIVLVEADGSEAVVLAADAPGVEIAPLETIDPTRRCARVSAADATGATLTGDVAAGLDRAEIALAAELVGVSQRALELTVSYAKERTQFGTPIGAFQAVSHRCAEMLRETEGARSAAYFAAWAADADPDALARGAALAKAAAADAGVHTTAAAIQVHGGIGFTWEADVHWLFKRAHVDAAQLRPARWHRARLARLAAASGTPVS
jgi:alkylation response protein AidB-like acyl-CoA dehydrogenase